MHFEYVIDKAGNPININNVQNVISNSTTTATVNGDYKGFIGFKGREQGINLPPILTSYVVPITNILYYQYNFINEFKAAGSKHNIDWRLLVALAFVESNFKANATSAVGAIGIMQIMPENRGKYSEQELYDPVKNIDRGAELFRENYKAVFNYTDYKSEQIKFALASYNAGCGNISKFVKKAKEKGTNPSIWDEGISMYAEDETKGHVGKVITNYIKMRKEFDD